MIKVSFNTKRKGVIVETGIMYALQRLGLAVSKPEGDNEPYDLILDIRTDKGNYLKKIQCKSAQLYGNSICISTKATNYKGGKICKHNYSSLDIDYFATIYNDIPILLPIEEFSKNVAAIHLRIGDRIKNPFCIYAKDYELKKVLVRQFGEFKEIESDFSWKNVRKVKNNASLD